MKAIMLSVQPQWVEKILNGEKTIEIRKTMPKCELPCKVYIYCTKEKLRTGKYVYVNELKIRKKFGVADHWCDYKTDYITINEGTPQLAYKTYLAKGKVVAEFILKEIETIEKHQIYNAQVMKKYACLSIQQLSEYTKGNKFHCWHIDNLKIYDKPKELSEFAHNVPDYSYGVVMYSLKKETLKRPPQSYMFVEEIKKE